jgi:DtxR family transcriptional regulator, Mn-dependent transcriptional regulator
MSRDRGHATAALSGAAQGYLLVARSIAGAGGSLTASIMAARLGVSKQAAAEMVARLVSDALLELNAVRELRLTIRGQEVSDAIFRRHALLEWLLTRIVGLSWAESDEEAMRLQSDVSPRLEARLRELLGDPPTCPHGNPIDTAAAGDRPAGVPLAEVEPASEVTIYRITEEAEEDVGLLTYLEGQDLVPGAMARVIEVSRSREAITLDGPRGRTTLGLRPAGLIRILPGRGDPSLFHRIPTLRVG